MYLAQELSAVWNSRVNPARQQPFDDSVLIEGFLFPSELETCQQVFHGDTFSVRKFRLLKNERILTKSQCKARKVPL